MQLTAPDGHLDYHKQSSKFDFVQRYYTSSLFVHGLVKTRLVNGSVVCESKLNIGVWEWTLLVLIVEWNSQLVDFSTGIDSSGST